MGADVAPGDDDALGLAEPEAPGDGAGESVAPPEGWVCSRAINSAGEPADGVGLALPHAVRSSLTMRGSVVRRSGASARAMPCPTACVAIRIKVVKARLRRNDLSVPLARTKTRRRHP